MSIACRLHAVVVGPIVLLLAGAAAAGEIEVVAKDVKFSRRPLWADGSLYFVEYGGHTILRLGERGPEKIWERGGCGPAALARAGADLHRQLPVAWSLATTRTRLCSSRPPVNQRGL
jgi:hypothetical protein